MIVKNVYFPLFFVNNKIQKFRLKSSFLCLSFALKLYQFSSFNSRFVHAVFKLRECQYVPFELLISSLIFLTFLFSLIMQTNSTPSQMFKPRQPGTKTRRIVFRSPRYLLKQIVSSFPQRKINVSK